MKSPTRSHARLAQIAIPLTVVFLYVSGLTAPSRAAAQSSPHSTPGPSAAKKNRRETVVRTKDIGCGEVIDVRATSAPVLWRDLNRMLIEDRFEPSEADDETSLVRRPPGKGCVYLVVDVKLRPGRSIGKYDWKLKYGDRVWPCLAISRDRLPYDPRTWQMEYVDELTVYHLLFEIPKGIHEGLLVFALPVTIPAPPVKLGWAVPGESTGKPKPTSAVKAPASTPPAPDATAKGKEGAENKPQ